MYLPYFKREFDKRRGNIDVLAGFVLFLAGIKIINFLCNIVNKTDKKQTSDFLISAMRFENIFLQSKNK